MPEEEFFSNRYFLILEQDLRFCLYAEQTITRILAYLLIVYSL